MTQAALLSAALWGIPRGKELRQPLADGQQGMEVLGPLACKELKPAKGHVSWMWIYSKFSDETQLWLMPDGGFMRDAEAEASAKLRSQPANPGDSECVPLSCYVWNHLLHSDRYLTHHPSQDGQAHLNFYNGLVLSNKKGTTSCHL